MLTQSPLIQNGDLVRNVNGQITLAPDIQTQCTVTVSAYDCMYNPDIDSGLIPYLNSIPVGGRNTATLSNIVSQAFQILISENLLSNLIISAMIIALNYVTIKIQAVDQQQNPVNLSWSNA